MISINLDKVHANSLRRAAVAMRIEHPASHERHFLWHRMADVMEEAAELYDRNHYSPMATACLDAAYSYLREGL